MRQRWPVRHSLVRRVKRHTSTTMIDELFQQMMRDDVSDWGVALLGVTGVPGSAERLSPAAIAAFANAELAHTAIDDPMLDRVVELASGDCATSAELREHLVAICDARNIDPSQARTTWQRYILKGLVADLEPDPVYGMIALSEFWTAWDWPDDMPATFKPDAAVSADQYHSDEYYERVKADHVQWLQTKMGTAKKIGASHRARGANSVCSVAVCQAGLRGRSLGQP